MPPPSSSVLATMGTSFLPQFSSGRHGHLPLNDKRRQLVDFMRKFRKVNPLDREERQLFQRRLLAIDSFRERDWLLAISTNS